MTDDSLAARVAAGRAARKQITRSDTGSWTPPPSRGDPVAILEKQATTRLPGLVPIRYGRMASAEFSFLRGAPAIMAADLSLSPNSGPRGLVRRRDGAVGAGVCGSDPGGP